MRAPHAPDTIPGREATVHKAQAKKRGVICAYDFSNFPTTNCIGGFLYERINEKTYLGTFYYSASYVHAWGNQHYSG